MSTAATHKLVRIDPANARESHSAHGVTITRVMGWCRVPVGLANELAKERMSELRPEASPPVFEVKSDEEARAIEEAELAQVEPAGTTEKPREIKVAARAKAPERESTR